MDFAVDIQLAQAARDELRDLGPEIDDEKALVEGAARRQGNKLTAVGGG